MSRRKSVSPHDSLGSNLIVQVKHDTVKRVLPLENEAINECWLSDKDRFSYEALDSDERLTRPMIRQGGAWQEVDWQTALEFVANGLKSIAREHGAASVGALLSPHSTLEELHLAQNSCAAWAPRTSIRGFASATSRPTRIAAARRGWACRLLASPISAACW